MPDESGSKARRTALKTFRLPVGLIEFLEKEAERRNTTVNALVSTILLENASWEARARDFGFVPIYRLLFRRLYEELEDDALDKIGREVVYGMWKEMAQYWFQDSSPQKILEILSSRYRTLPFVQTEVKNQAGVVMVMAHHDLGPKGAVMLRGALDALARVSFQSQPKIDVGDTLVTLEFPVRQ